MLLREALVRDGLAGMPLTRGSRSRRSGVDASYERRSRPTLERGPLLREALLVDARGRRALTRAALGRRSGTYSSDERRVVFDAEPRVPLTRGDRARPETWMATTRRRLCLWLGRSCVTRRRISPLLENRGARQLGFLWLKAARRSPKLGRP